MNRSGTPRREVARVRQVRTMAIAVLIPLSAMIGAGRVQAQPLVTEAAPPALQARNTAFMAAVDTRPPRELAGFFPRTGDLVYRSTVYSDSGTTVREQRFPAGEIPAALAGPLWDVLMNQVEGQTVGVFAHQVSLRGREWRYVGRQRFVPPRAGNCSAIYIQWRPENGAWVISEIADEEFRTETLPAWCC